MHYAGAPTLANSVKTKEAKVTGNLIPIVLSFGAERDIPFASDRLPSPKKLSNNCTASIDDRYD